jgi:hypothetical protein
MGQIVEIEPDQMNAAHPVTTSAVVMIDPGSHVGCSNFL